jgi:hypothetical protein
MGAHRVAHTEPGGQARSCGMTSGQEVFLRTAALGDPSSLRAFAQLAPWCEEAFRGESVRRGGGVMTKYMSIL